MSIGLPKNIKLREQKFTVEELLEKIANKFATLYDYENILDDKLVEVNPNLNYLNEVFDKYLEIFNELLMYRSLITNEVEKLCEFFPNQNFEKCQEYFDNLDIINEQIMEIDQRLELYLDKINNVGKLLSEEFTEITIVEEPVPEIIEDDFLDLEQLKLEAKNRGLIYKNMLKNKDNINLLKIYIIDDDEIDIVPKNREFFQRYTLKKLKQIARNRNMKKYSNLNKDKLIDKLLE